MQLLAGATFCFDEAPEEKMNTRRMLVSVFTVWMVGQGLNTVISVEPRSSH